MLGECFHGTGHCCYCRGAGLSCCRSDDSNDQECCIGTGRSLLHTAATSSNTARPRGHDDLHQKGWLSLAAFKKYNEQDGLYQLTHNTRESKKLRGDIDLTLTHQNFSVAPPDRGGCLPNKGKSAKPAIEFYKRRLDEVYQYGKSRKDLITICEWDISAPKDLLSAQEADFWQESYNFLNSLYGESNCIQCIVHADEVGQNHMHYMFIPVVKNKKYQHPNRSGNITGSAIYSEKVCAKDLMTAKHLLQFHPHYQKWLTDHGVQATVHSGVTGGKNKTVVELKKDTLMELEKTKAQLAERSQELLNAQTELSSLRSENKDLHARISELEHSLHQEQNQTISTSWGSSSSWGKDLDNEWIKNQ